MDTKTKILALLESQRGQTLSGTDIAGHLQISRNAVWKAVRQLCAAGHQIEAGTNRGYCLRPESDVLSAEGIRPFLETAGLPLAVHASVGSTNQLAKSQAIDGAPHGTVILADAQTEGQGRYGRSFFSPPGCGIYMSILSRRVPYPAPTLMTLHAAAAVCEAIETVCAKAPAVKWVNDIFYKGKKICGISNEAAFDMESGGIQWMVTGIGINFRAAPLPENLQAVAGALYAEAEQPPITRNRLAAEVINRFMAPAADPQMLLAQYRRRLFFLGQPVQVLAPRPYTALAEDVDANGHLIVLLDSGERRVLSAGEISVRPVFSE